ncbi:hypothetical protein G4D63_18560 [Bacillus mesophilus]|uniref:Uncharacterized protein n=1 Tax=Bacillus mesophilus TaxID=1808955 RepID=A0A6M0QDP0_9BACI|nr:hypothetical protein [Bacillus mesophilus]
MPIKHVSNLGKIHWSQPINI